MFCKTSLSYKPLIILTAVKHVIHQYCFILNLVDNQIASPNNELMVFIKRNKLSL